MAIYVSEIFDQIRDLLNDPSDTQVPFSTKRLYVNNAIRRMWPRVWRLAQTTITVLADTYDYALLASAAQGTVVAVELQNDYGYTRFEDYDIIDGDEDQNGVFRLSRSPNAADLLGYTIRITYAAPIAVVSSTSYVAAQAEEWIGPDRAIHLPALYAMGMIVARKIDDRQDTTRYSTTQAINGVTDSDIMQASQLWIGQFEAELADMEKPLPIARD